MAINTKDPQEKTKKCRREIEIILNKYSCGMTSTPSFKVEAGGYLKVESEIKIAPLVKIVKPKKTNGEPRYIN